MKLSHSQQADALLKDLRENLPFFVRDYLDPALAGDVEAASFLACCSPNWFRGKLCVLFYLIDAPLDAYRSLFHSVWEHDHRYVIAAAKSRQRLRAMFRRAQLPLPDDLPAIVRIWRGTSALPFSQAVRGYSWTLSRDVACWFAMRFAEKNKHALVISAVVPRSSILHYSNDRHEQEVVCFDIPGAVQDGNEDDWLEVFCRHEEEKQADRRAMHS